MVVPAAVVGREGARTIVDLWGARVPVRGEASPGERRSVCLHVEDLAMTSSLTRGAISGRVVAAAYQGAATLLTIRPDAEGAPQLRVEHASAPPAVGASIAVAVRDGWIIPRRAPRPEEE
jgi:hypothetical protein